MSTDFRALARSLNNDADRMDTLCKGLVRDASALEGDMYSVSDDWTVKDLYNYELGFLIADANDDTAARAQLEKLQQQRAQEAANETRHLVANATELTQIDQQAAKAISSHLDTIAKLTPASADLSKKRATQDMATLSGQNLDGSEPTDAQKKAAADRLHAAADLSDGTRDALKSSGQAGISQEKYDYLEGVAAQLPDNVSNYDDIGGDLTPEQHKAVQGDVADTLRILGNPSVSTLNGDRGGMDKLPKNVRTLLTESPTGTRSVSRHPIDAKNPNTTESVPTSEFKRFDDWRAFTNTLSSGDQDLRLGSDVDRGLLKQASEIAGQVTPSTDAQEYTADSNIPNQDIEVRKTLDAMLNNASGDHEAVHDLVTGDNMKATISGGGAYNVNDHLNGLMQHQWSPDEQGARNLFDWVRDPGSVVDHGHQGQLTGETATGLGRYLSENAHSLNHIQVSGGDEYTSLGRINPELTRGVASDLTPHLGGLAGMPDSTLSNTFVSGFEHRQQLSDMIGVFAGDPQAAQTIHHGAQDWIRVAAFEAGQHPELDTGFASNAGSLQQALKDGLASQYEAIQQNSDYGKAVHDNQWGTMYDTASGAASLIPGVGPLVGVISPEAKLALQGGPDVPGAPPTTQDLRDLAQLQSRSGVNPLPPQIAWTEGYLQQHRDAIPLFQDFMTDGRLDWTKVHDDPKVFTDLFARMPESDKWKTYYDGGLQADDLNPKPR
ncbi:TPR repeat region-containing protein [Williamsia sp. M5A3_1d]